MKRHSLLMAIVALAVASIATAQTQIKPGWNLFSPQDDVQIGAQSAQQAEQQLPILNDPAAEAYVNRIGQRLAQNAGGPNFQYRFRIVNQSDINAFALPGGFVYVNRGVLDNAKNEGEVAGVLAHEISHVALRHGTHQASKAYATQAGLSILGGILGGHVGAGTAEILNAIGGVGLNALFLKYSRDLESQADIRGVQILTASGYSPQDMINFFRTLESVDTSKKTSWLSDHPAPPDRIARLQREEQMLRAPATPTENVAQLHQVQADMARFGRAPSARQTAQAMTSSSRGRSAQSGGSAPSIQIAAPSSSMRTFTSRSHVFSVEYPSNWKVYTQGSNGVTIAPPGGVGQVNGQNEIVVGAMLNHYDPFGTTGGGVYENSVSIEDATNDLLGQIHQGSPYLQLVNGSTQQFNVSGGRALAVAMRGTDPNTNITERVELVTRQLSDGHLIYMIFVTPESQSGQYGRVLQAMVNSLQVSGNARH